MRYLILLMIGLSSMAYGQKLKQPFYDANITLSQSDSTVQVSWSNIRLAYLIGDTLFLNIKAENIGNKPILIYNPLKTIFTPEIADSTHTSKITDSGEIVEIIDSSRILQFNFDIVNDISTRSWSQRLNILESNDSVTYEIKTSVNNVLPCSKSGVNWPRLKCTFPYWVIADTLKDSISISDSLSGLDNDSMNDWPKLNKRMFEGGYIYISVICDTSILVIIK
jgi:hypothetical protein